jgi:hypothetical protein
VRGANSSLIPSWSVITGERCRRLKLFDILILVLQLSNHSMHPHFCPCLMTLSYVSSNDGKDSVTMDEDLILPGSPLERSMLSPRKAPNLVNSLYHILYQCEWLYQKYWMTGCTWIISAEGYF